MTDGTYSRSSITPIFRIKVNQVMNFELDMVIALIPATGLGTSHNNLI